MTKAGERILRGAREALAYTQGDMSKGIAHVPLNSEKMQMAAAKTKAVKHANVVPGLVATRVYELSDDDWNAVERVAGIASLSLVARTELEWSFQRYQSAKKRSTLMRRGALAEKLTKISASARNLKDTLKSILADNDAVNQLESLIATHYRISPRYQNLHEIMWTTAHLAIGAELALKNLPEDTGGKVHTGIGHFIRSVYETLKANGMKGRYSRRSDKRKSPVVGKLVEVLKIFFNALPEGMRLDSSTIGHAVKAALT